MNIDFEQLKNIDLAAISAEQVKRQLAMPAAFSIERLAALISPAATAFIEDMARLSSELTIRRFGRTINLYAPLYVSNYCVNACVYCGYNCKTHVQRTRLTVEEAMADADILAGQGFRHILLVAGEDKKYIDADYLSRLGEKLRGKFASISIEVYQLELDEYEKLAAAGVDGMTLYQETYDRDIYAKLHCGPKADYDRRLLAHETAAKAGFRRVGLGSLLGLTDFRFETLALGAHAAWLMKNFWRTQVSFSFPRLRPAAEVDFNFAQDVSDTDLVQMIFALRLCFADSVMYLSTRERGAFRDNLIGLGITSMSAGSKTNPGGYTGSNALEQFNISDPRTPDEVARAIEAKGFEPVWKDFDAAFAK
ncbi:MAG: thiamine biosynthesis protein ThiH [Planctomycetes bacterium GWF2_50_10]|nr:MAG: thiamine biosynthesis protein ThiH [Planctomycetes bacterium GWF2_50_10]